MKKILIITVVFMLTSIVNSQEFKFGKVSKDELNEKFYKHDTTANAVFIYRNRNSYFKYVQEQGFQLVTEVHERIKIYNKEAYNWATKNIYYYDSHQGKEKISGLKASTFNLEGNKIVQTKLSKKEIFDEEKNKYWSLKKFTLPNLKEGCVIEWKYRLTSPFRRIDDLQFQFSIPVKKMDAKISIPEYFRFKKRQKGYYFVQVNTEMKRDEIVLNHKTRSGGGSSSNPYAKVKYNQQKIALKTTIDKYNVLNIPALIEEDYVSNIDNFKTAIQYEYASSHWPQEPIKYYSQSWDDVTKTIYKSSSFGSELGKKNYFKNDLNQLITSTKNKNQLIVAIFEFVKRKIVYNNVNGVYTYNGVREAYKKGVGNDADINLVLVSMLREAGLNANPVLISTRNHGISYFPTIDGFNYVIAVVETDKGTVLLDATSKYSTPNVLPMRVRNWQGRIVRENGSSSWVNLGSKQISETKYNINISLDEEGFISGMNRTVYTNFNGLTYRNKYASIKDDEIIAKIEQDNGDIEISDFRNNNLNNPYKSVVELYKFESEDLVEIIGGKLQFYPLLFNSITVNPFKLEKRDYPIDFGTPFLKQNMISIKIPKGYSVESMPENLAIGLPKDLGTYVFSIKNLGSIIQISSKIQIKSQTLPSTEYSAIKEFYSLMVKKNKERIVLVKTQS